MINFVLDGPEMCVPDILCDVYGVMLCCPHALQWPYYQCYSIINGISGILQVVVIPMTVKHFDPQRLWVLMPLVILVGTFCMVKQMSCALSIVAPTFMAMKTMEFSLRGVANEMVRRRVRARLG